jgi:hypothetical protein
VTKLLEALVASVVVLGCAAAQAQPADAPLKGHSLLVGPQTPTNPHQTHGTGSLPIVTVPLSGGGKATGRAGSDSGGSMPTTPATSANRLNTYNSGRICQQWPQAA